MAANPAHEGIQATGAELLQRAAAGSRTWPSGKSGQQLKAEARFMAIPAMDKVKLGFGRIVDLHDRSSTS
jgi:hypothetical protein